MKKSLMQAIVFTLLAVDLMLGGLLLAKHQLPPEKVVPSFAKSSEPNLEIGYTWELYKASIEGPYLVEHYKEYECIYNKSGHLLSKRPTNEETYLRYWRENHSP
jgi:hypothetical protein